MAGWAGCDEGELTDTTDGDGRGGVTSGSRDGVASGVRLVSSISRSTTLSARDVAAERCAEHLRNGPLRVTDASACTAVR